MKVKVSYLAHSFFKISSSGKNLLVDPFFEHPSQQRLIKCPITESSLKNIDVILITHEHPDHFDKAAIERIANREKCAIVATRNVLNELNINHAQCIEVSSYDEKLVRGFKITTLPAHHPTAFYPVSYLIKIGNKTIFHAGDTTLKDEFAEIKADLSLLPIAGKATMDVVDAVKATKMIKPKYAVPMHYNTFEHIKIDPREFSYRIDKSILKTKPVILKPGKSITI